VLAIDSSSCRRAGCTRGPTPAQQFGLGGVIDVSFTIGVELYDRPNSKLTATLCSHVVDGFFGCEQAAQITPRMVRMLIAGPGQQPLLSGRSA